MNEYHTKIKIEVMKVFDIIATSYSYLRSRGWDIVLKVIDDKTYRVCDVGSGPGSNALQILRKKPDLYVICMDISVNMLNIAKKRFMKKSLYVSVDLVQGDMEFMPFRDLSFDSMIYIASLHHIPTSKGRVEALNEAYRVTKSGGKILITVWALLQPRFIPHIAKNIIHKVLCSKCLESIKDVLIPWRYKGKVLLRYYHLFTLGELRKLVSRTRFKIIESGRYNIHKKIYPENYYVLAIKD